MGRALRRRPVPLPRLVERGQRVIRSHASTDVTSEPNEPEDRRSWRARSGAERRVFDRVWDFATGLALFPGIGMVVAALGGRRGQSLDVDETWVLMLAASTVVLILIIATVARRAAGAVPLHYPRTFFGATALVAVAAPAIAWIRFDGVIPPLGWFAVAVCAVTALLALAMLRPPRGTGRG